MGQIAAGVLYGVQVTDAMRLYDDEADDGGLMELWQKHSGETWGGFRLVSTSEASPWLVGYWLALGGSGMESVDYLGDPAKPLDAYAKGAAYQRAKRAWDRFAKWARAEHGLKLPRAKLWLTATEVA